MAWISSGWSWNPGIYPGKNGAIKAPCSSECDNPKAWPNSCAAVCKKFVPKS